MTPPPEGVGDDSRAGTINEDGLPVLIESFYYRYYAPYFDEHDSVEEATRSLRYGEECGELSAVGVFVDGRCVRARDESEAPSEDRRRRAQEDYDRDKAQAQDVDTCSHPPELPPSSR